jgi:hypothetical protein
LILAYERRQKAAQNQANDQPPQGSLILACQKHLIEVEINMVVMLVSQFQARLKDNMKYMFLTIPSVNTLSEFIAQAIACNI